MKKINKKTKKLGKLLVKDFPRRSVVNTCREPSNCH